jgi:hypothetical protein
VRLKVGFLVISALLVVAVVALGAGVAVPAGKGLYRLVGLFGEVVGLVRGNYVEEVPYEKLEMGALTGMVEAADPGGAFVPADSAPAFEKCRSRAVPAFGVVLGKRASYPAVLQVLPGSPAAAAGILPGELVERVGEEPVRARPLWRAQVLLDQAELDLHVLDANPARARHQDREAGDVAYADIRNREPSDILREYPVVHREAAERHV